MYCNLHGIGYLKVYSKLYIVDKWGSVAAVKKSSIFYIRISFFFERNLSKQGVFFTGKKLQLDTKHEMENQHEMVSSAEDSLTFYLQLTFGEVSLWFIVVYMVFAREHRLM